MIQWKIFVKKIYMFRGKLYQAQTTQQCTNNEIPTLLRFNKKIWIILSSCSSLDILHGYIQGNIVSTFWNMVLMLLVCIPHDLSINVLISTVNVYSSLWHSAIEAFKLWICSWKLKLELDSWSNTEYRHPFTQMSCFSLTMVFTGFTINDITW